MQEFLSTALTAQVTVAMAVVVAMAVKVGVAEMVETVAMWSPRDGIIAPRAACGLPGERDRAVALRCTHMGFSNSAEVIHAVLAELERA